MPMRRSVPTPPLRALPLLATLLLTVACESPVGSYSLRAEPSVLEAVGDTRQLEAIVVGTDRLPEWESLRPEIVTVTRDGLATAVSPGEGLVKARIGRREIATVVTVLPAVDLKILSVSKQPAQGGYEQATLRMNNPGGRGYYRTRFYRASSAPGGEPQLVYQDESDHEIPGRADDFMFSVPVPAPVDWVIVRTREPRSEVYGVAACVRFDGVAGCPMTP
jgi:hypothetical protein